MNPGDLLTRARVLLLDFDGPVCSVFAGIPSHVVADQLRGILTEGGHTALPDAVATSTDPFDVFRHAATLGPEEARYVEAAFTAHEVEAIPTAVPTYGAHELIKAWHASGRPLAIVSNNSVTAIGMYLDLYGLRRSVDAIAARTSHDPTQLKPHPYLLHQALTALDTTPAECVFIGDSITDLQAAEAAGIPFIGYANKPGKHTRFTNAKADAITDTLTDLEPIR